MAYVSDGSRVCDASRVALAAINADYTLTSLSNAVIYCAAIDGTTGDRLRPLGVGTVTLHWRRAGGTFAAMTDTTEVAIALSGTVLLNGQAVDATSARCNETATFVAAGVEVMGATTSQTTPLLDVRDNESAEWQYALDFSNALGSQTYDFRHVVVQDAGTNTIDYATSITTPSTGSPTLQQEGFQFRNDDGSESTATSAAAQDANLTAPMLTPKRLRFLINSTDDTTSASYQLEYRKVGDPSWKKITP